MTEDRWRHLTYWPLVAASFLFIVVYSWQVIANVQGTSLWVSRAITGSTWVIFAIDYVVRLTLAKRKGKWFRSHLFDLLVVALPALKPLLLLRALTEVQRHVSRGQALRTRIATFAGGAVLVLVWVASLAELDVERNAPGATITSFGDAIWWAFVTITTVGYGDVTPVTITGRVVAVFLMSAGIAVVGVVTATTASWIVERAAGGDDDAETATRGQIRLLARQLDDLSQRMPAVGVGSPSAVVDDAGGAAAPTAKP